MVLFEALLSYRLGEGRPGSAVFVFSIRFKERIITFTANVCTGVKVIFVDLTLIPTTEGHNLTLLDNTKRLLGNCWG